MDLVGLCDVCRKPIVIASCPMCGARLCAECARKGCPKCTGGKK